MKKITLFLLMLLLVTTAALGQENQTAVSIPSVLKRNIKPVGQNTDGSFPANEAISGVSSTTGLPVGGQKYVPILLTIDNNWAAWPQWGLVEADIIYEMPISGGGWTRLVALYADQYPDEAGPSRSARVMHADLREEWDALLLHYGEQTDEGSNFLEVIRDYGVRRKGLEIDGIGNKYSQYFPRVRYHKAPHNVSVYVQKLHDLIVGIGYNFPQRPFKFTDEQNYSGPKAVKIDLMHKENKDESSTFLYDANRKSYVRYNSKGVYSDLLKPDIQLYYSNVVVQRTKLTFNYSSSMPLMNDVVGSGAADIFIGGRYIEGAWTRSSAQNRTVFLDQNGQEIALQRGKTWIVVCSDDTQVSYQTQLDEDTAAFYSEMGTFPKYKPLRLGDNNDDVKKMKQRLTELGYMKGTTFNNQYQESTAQSVMDYERKNGLPVDGIADSLMLHKLYEGMEPIQVFAESLQFESAVQTEIQPTAVPAANEQLDLIVDIAEVIVKKTPVILSSTYETTAKQDVLKENNYLPEQTIPPTDTFEITAGKPDDTLEEIPLDGKVFAIVKTPNKGALNFRMSESKSAKLISKIKNGVEVQVLLQGEEWTKILHNETEGYVMSSFLKFRMP